MGVVCLCVCMCVVCLCICACVYEWYTVLSLYVVCGVFVYVCGIYVCDVCWSLWHVVCVYG